ncbi:non-hydrolyzing UDP-N-acetylglucosamine 2-epimerase [uncultured Fusobacterium sp.]|uniref:non-hydrolyzing UDP-N-acetylglucosamine 2-epimerase n=1 Tax=uncultured Fusobacterium sp. TaxID=159267 RepID=UPI0027DAB777|nr:UDP-N-acetylglucosamine 2-epimerase (non-hydrolyzing) [uncultured Fusobacterium sp.]
MKIITIVGARPQFIKSSIVSKKLKEENIKEIYIHTGQHYDENMSDIFFKELEIEKPKYNLCIGSATHGEQTGKMIIEIEKILLNERPDGVLLYGDTNSTLSGAIVASKLNIPIFHIEGGVRTHDAKMPEEINRVITDHVSTIIFSPTSLGMKELEKEGLLEKSINSGDVMLDRLLETVNHYQITEGVSSKNNLITTEYYLLTLHRPHNVDSRERLKKILETLNTLDKKIIFPIHPRTKNKMKEFNLLEKNYTNIYFINPLGYKEMMKYVKLSAGVLTDSGGLQKEACFLGKKCINIYEHTGWKELEKLGCLYVWKDLNKDILEKELKRNINTTALLKEFGNGKASKTIVNEIYTYLSERKKNETI